MEYTMDWVCFVLLLLVYRITILVNCDTYNGIQVSELKNDNGRLFLRMRRLRVMIGKMTLLTCSVRIGFCYLVIPLANMISRLFRTDIRYVLNLASTGEQYFIIGICSVILLGYILEKRIWKRFIRELEEEET